MPSKLCNSVVGSLCIMSFGILFWTHICCLFNYSFFYFLYTLLSTFLPLLPFTFVIKHTTMYLASFRALRALICCNAGESLRIPSFSFLANSSREGKAISNPIGMCSAFSSSSFQMFWLKKAIPRVELKKNGD